MTLTVKVLLIAALMLSIIIPFGYFLIGEKNKKRYKRSLAVNVFFFFGAFLVAGITLFAGMPVQAAETDELIGKLFDGSADQLFASLLGRKKLSAVQIERLREMVKEME